MGHKHHSRVAEILIFTVTPLDFSSDASFVRGSGSGVVVTFPTIRLTICIGSLIETSLMISVVSVFYAIKVQTISCWKLSKLDQKLMKDNPTCLFGTPSSIWTKIIARFAITAGGNIEIIDRNVQIPQLIENNSRNVVITGTFVTFERIACENQESEANQSIQ